MEPVTAIVTALAAGAGAALKDTAKQALKDAYDGLKNLVKAHYAQVNVEELERAPSSEARKMVIEEELRQSNAQDDAKLLEKAKALLEVIRNDPKEASVTGIDIAEVVAASLNISRVISTGTAVKITGSKFRDDINIADVRAGKKDE